MGPRRLGLQGVTSRHFTIADRRARLASLHRLLPDERTDDVAAVTRSLAALHATDPATVYLTAMARMRSPSIEAVADAIHERRSIVRHHAMRRTVWMFEPPLARAAHASCTAALAVKEWRTMAKFVEASAVADDGEAWCAAARATALHALERLAPRTARQLGAAEPALTVKLLLSQGKTYAGAQGAHTRLVQNLGFDGAIVRTRSKGSWISGEYVWELAGRWIDGGLVDPSLSTTDGAAVVAAAYLTSFGPATTADLQWWTGWSAGVTKAALAAIGAVAVTMDDGDGAVSGWVSADDPALHGERLEQQPWVAILPSLDPTIMGWKQRSWYLGELAAFGGPLFDRNGNAGHSIWADGEVVGTWVQRRSGEIVTHLFRDVGAETSARAAEAAAHLEALLGESRVSPRYPAPIQAQLLAEPSPR
jgi:hypothetical protein